MNINYGTSYVNYNRNNVSTFYIRLNNTANSDVTVSGLNNLMSGYTGNPKLMSAEFEDNDGTTYDVKGTQNQINDFTVVSKHGGIFIIKWNGGLFSLNGTASNGYNTVAVSSGFELFGNYDIPDNFMAHLFYGCTNYNQQVGDVFDSSNLHPVTIGDYFMQYCFSGCTSLINYALPDTGNWPVTGIGDYFMQYMFNGCSNFQFNTLSLTGMNTGNWNVTSIGNNFMQYTFNGCNRLTDLTLIDTTNWHVTSIGNNFMEQCITNCNRVLNVTLIDTGNWNVTSIGDFFISGLYSSDQQIINIPIINTTNWNVTSIGNYFCFALYANCQKQIEQAMPDTTNWNVTSRGINTCYNAFGSVFTQSGTLGTATLKGSFYSTLTLNGTYNSMSINNTYIQYVKVDAALIPTYQSSQSWSNIDDSKFISW